MTTRLHFILCLALSVLVLGATGAGGAEQTGEKPRPIKGLLHNEDCNSFFYRTGFPRARRAR